LSNVKERIDENLENLKKNPVDLTKLTEASFDSYLKQLTTIKELELMKKYLIN
jgi:hypothetical protein